MRRAAITGSSFIPKWSIPKWRGRFAGQFCHPDLWLFRQLDNGGLSRSAIAAIREQVGTRGVICGLSGGVDSSVAAVLIHQAIGDQLTCVFVDTGLMRAGEADEVVSLFRGHYNIPLVHHDASDLFLSRLDGVTDPEQKRKIIGKSFIEVFDEEAAKVTDAGFLAQGTLISGCDRDQIASSAAG